MSAPFQYALDFTEALPPAAQERIAAGMQQAADNADDKWWYQFGGCIMSAARKKEEITSDDVIAEIEALPKPAQTHNLGAIGPAMKQAAAMGILINTGRTVRSRRPEKNGNLHIVWRSLLMAAGHPSDFDLSPGTPAGADAASPPKT